MAQKQAPIEPSFRKMKNSNVPASVSYKIISFVPKVTLTTDKFKLWILLYLKWYVQLKKNQQYALYQIFAQFHLRFIFQNKKENTCTKSGLIGLFVFFKIVKIGLSGIKRPTFRLNRLR